MIISSSRHPLFAEASPAGRSPIPSAPNSRARRRGLPDCRRSAHRATALRSAQCRIVASRPCIAVARAARARGTPPRPHRGRRDTSPSCSSCPPIDRCAVAGVRSPRSRRTASPIPRAYDAACRGHAAVPGEDPLGGAIIPEISSRLRPPVRGSRRSSRGRLPWSPRSKTDSPLAAARVMRSGPLRPPRATLSGRSRVQPVELCRGDRPTASSVRSAPRRPIVTAAFSLRCGRALGRPVCNREKLRRLDGETRSCLSR